MTIEDFPDALKSPVRLAIIAGLLDGEKTFSELKTIVGATDGNLGAHIRRLETDGYVNTRKAFVGRKPQSTVSLSEKGRESFTSYVSMLEEIVKRANEKSDRGSN